MATHRYISTTFWDDAWIQELEPSEKYIYLYLMTNPLTSISGVYKITERRISFDTGCSMEQVKTILSKFEKDRKAFRYAEWIILPSWPKHQNLNSKADISLGIISELQNFPDDLFSFLKDSDYAFDLNSVKRTVIAYKANYGIGGALQKRVKEKSKNCCAKCGSNGKLFMHRKIAISDGGDNSFENLEAFCETCYKNADIRTPPTDVRTPPTDVRTPPTDIRTPPTDIRSCQDTPYENQELFNSIKFNLIESKFNINGGESVLSDKTADCGKPVDNSKPPPPIFEKIKTDAKTYGYFLDDAVIIAITHSIINSDWFLEKHSIINFAAVKITESYADKPKTEQKKLFISALTKWPNIIEEYPFWLEQQKKNERLNEIEVKKRSPPKICAHCGSDMNCSQRCPKCKSLVIFNDEKSEWEWEKIDEIPYFDQCAEDIEF